MKKLTGQQIRTIWLNFFKERGHLVEPGASLVPHNDPTLLWINSGVAALKKYFDGSEVPPNRRITNVQKSIRTNDIENVGKTARHHTFFEMLGNFSIGDYFRETIIPWAFEILTSEKYFGIDADKLYFTYLPTDKDTYNLWIKCGVKPDHLIALEGNYWQIGAGPSGPNTEVFYDRGSKYDPSNRGILLLQNDEENDRYIEIWGIVFSQYNAVEGVDRSEYKELPQKNIDTGAGLERIACVVQETPTNFETDLFYPLILATEKLAALPYQDGNLMPYRVIADHVRSCTFALADGASFSNEGRGYVLRRILRRAMRYGRKIGINDAFLYKLVPVVVDMFTEAYPYLKTRELVVSKMIKAEEEKFIKTLTAGEGLLRKMIEGQKVLSGEEAFKLYDTFGFPLDLTIEICAEENVTVDTKVFNHLLDLQRERAREARKDLQSMAIQSENLLAFTEESAFIYDQVEPIKAKVIGLFEDGKAVEQLSEKGEVIFDRTIFYAESGGQVADRGTLSDDDTFASVIRVAKAPNHQHLHSIELDYGTIKLGQELTLTIDTHKRLLTMRNHSATHLLNQALTEVLGNDVHQAGSFVNDEYLRFDINYLGAISNEAKVDIERRVNNYIALALPQITQILPIEEAKQVGAKALFDEKYGAFVRVVSFGDVSKEFCGGTHVKNTQDIGVFVIESEHSIAAGIRRIEGRTSAGAYQLIKIREKILDDVQTSLKSLSYHDVVTSLSSLQKEKEEWKAAYKQTNDRLAALSANHLRSQFEVVSNVHLLVAEVKNSEKNALTAIVDSLKTAYDDGIIVLIGEDGDKLPVIVSVAKQALAKGNKAGDIVKAVSMLLGGSGGGRPDFAFGAGKNRVDLEQIKTTVKGLLK